MIMKELTKTAVIEYLTDIVTPEEMIESIKYILFRLGDPDDDDAAVLLHFIDALEGQKVF